MKLKHFIPRLNRVPTWVFGVTYLFAIPIFALLFSRWPQEFYHSTVRYERDLEADEREILDELRLSAMTTFQSNSFVGPNLERLVAWQYVKFYHLRLNNQEFSFALDPNLLNVPPTAPRVRFGLWSPRTASGDRAKMYAVIIDATPPDVAEAVRGLFPVNRAYYADAPAFDTGYIVISQSLEES